MKINKNFVYSIQMRGYLLRMSNTNQLEAAIGKHNARMDAHTAHGAKVRAMYSARASGKKKQASKEEYETEWNAYNKEEDALKRMSFIPFFDLAKAAGVQVSKVKGYKLEIAEILAKAAENDGIMGESIIAKDWTMLTEKEGPPRLDRDFTDYGAWRKEVVERLLPNGTEIERQALRMELANAITAENGKDGIEPWQHHIVGQHVAAQLMTGEHPGILAKAKARALSDEFSQWYMSGMFEGKSVSAEAFDTHSKKRPIPAGYERKGDKIQPAEILL